MADQVYEGEVSLKIDPFLDQLTKLETAVSSTVATLSALFATLDASITASFGGAKTALQSIGQSANTVGGQVAAGGATVKAAVQAVQQSYVGEIKAGNAQEIALIKQKYAEQASLQKQANNGLLLDLRTADSARAQQISDSFSAQVATARTKLAELRKIQQDALSQATAAKGDSRVATTPSATKSADEAYTQAVAGAKRAATEEAEVAKQLTTALAGERAAQARNTAAFFKEDIEDNKNAARQAVAIWEQANAASQANGTKLATTRGQAWKTQVGQAVADAREQIKKVEDDWNSVFRAGSQLASVGTGITAFSAGLAVAGQQLTTNAGEFDFWSRRVVAAAQAANTELYAGFGGSQQQTIAAFSDSILKAGRELGQLKPEEVAQSWYLYQAATGAVVTSQEDLNQKMAGVSDVLKASIVSNTGYETAIRGVTQAMAEFGLGSDQMSHATAVMLNLTQTSQAEFSDVLEAFKMVGPQAAILGVSLEETSAIMARLSDSGLRGSSAGRGLSVALSTLLDPSTKADDALTALFNTSKGLPGVWQDIVFKGGNFIGFLDTLDAKGKVTAKGFFHEFADATKGMTEAQRQSQLAMVFSQNGMRTMIPLIKEYTDATADGATTTATGKVRMEGLAAAFADTAKQATLFGEQWQIVSESLKSRMGRATYAIQEALTRLGFVVAETFLPLLEWVSTAITAFVEWGNTHPALVRGFVTIAAALGIIAAIVGPALIIMGTLLQSIASVALVVETLSASTGVLGAVFAGLSGAAAATVAPLLILIGVLALLGLAWKTNFAGMGETLGQVFQGLADEAGAIGNVLEQLFQFIGAVFSGNEAQMREAGDRLGAALLEALIVLPQQIGASLGDAAAVLGDWAGSTFGSLAESMAVWGYNLMVSLANGISEASQYVFDSAVNVAAGIAQYFQSFSPPKFGPLKGIYVWGRNLIHTFVDGMNAADITAVADIAGRIGDAFKLNVEVGDGDATQYVETMQLANEKAAQMVGIIQDGGQVSADFFEVLRGGLGEWYDSVVEILLAYQDVYALEHSIKLEKAKLDVLKAQRKEIDAQAQARQDAFDQALGKGGTDDYANPGNQAEMVDPTTDTGKAKIAEMRGKLGAEEFQNWLNWQKKLWDQKQTAEDKALDKQEDAQQKVIDAQQTALDTAKAQYEYYVKLYDYAQKMLDLQKEEDAFKDKKEKGGAGGGAGPKASPYGTPEDLAAAKGEIGGAVGADGALLDEGRLIDNRGGDVIGGLGDATRQKEKEAERLAALETLNRKKRADFESQLINATSDEERTRIKQQKDAWDAAYKDEKSRLQERIAFTKDVEEAATKQADATKEGREADKRKENEAAIKALLGDQTGAILDANQLKGDSKNLDEAALKAKAQLQNAEHGIADLRALDKQKQLEFEQKIREAGKDPEKVRRIKEEKEAWDTSYKSALAVAEARAEAARRVSQEIGNENQQAKIDAPPKGGGGAAPKPIGGIGGGGVAAPRPVTLPTLPTVPTKAGGGEVPQRESLTIANKYWEDVKKGWQYVTSDAVATKEKWAAVGTALKETFGYKSWWDALGPEDFRTRVQGGFKIALDGIGGTFTGFTTWFSLNWNGFWAGVGSKYTEFTTWFSGGWNTFWGGVSGKYTEFTTWFSGAWAGLWASLVAIWNPIQAWAFDSFAVLRGIVRGALEFIIGLFALAFLGIQTAGTIVVTAITKIWSDFVAWAGPYWNTFTTTLKGYFDWLAAEGGKVWNTFTTWLKGNFDWVAEQGKTVWDTFTSWLKGNAESVTTSAKTAWDGFTSWLKGNADSVTGSAKTAWDGFTGWLKGNFTTVTADGKTLWEGLTGSLTSNWTAFKSWWDLNVLPLWGNLKTAAEGALKTVKDKWDDLVTAVSNTLAPLGGIVSAIQALGRVSMPGWLSDLLGGGGGPKAASPPARAQNAVTALTGAAQQATNRAVAATAPRTVNSTTTNSSTKNVTVNVDRVDASNPDDGRAFLNKLAFLA